MKAGRKALRQAEKRIPPDLRRQIERGIKDGQERFDATVKDIPTTRRTTTRRAATAKRKTAAVKRTARRSPRRTAPPAVVMTPPAVPEAPAEAMGSGQG
ncbi:MAG: hypothetical protein E6H97_04555 [Chloroflexi bacterium]|nr:MAG: hypothetical protein E6H97_04555 [Chloroflexota bacterium]